MPSSSNPEGGISPAAMLLNPKAYSKQMAHGNPLSSSPTPTQTPTAPMEIAASEAPSAPTHPDTPSGDGDVSNTLPGENNDQTYSSTEGRVKPTSPASRTPNNIGNSKPTNASPLGTAFDPRQLLGPRNYKINPSTTSTSTTPTSNNGSTPVDLQKKRDFEDFGSTTGQGSLIENMYGVENRVNQPPKKRKTDDDPALRAAADFSVSSNNTGLGEYMKEGQGAAVNGAPTKANAVIDLTSDKDDETNTTTADDDVIIVSDTDLGMKEVCYGRLEGATIVAHRIPKPVSKVFGLGARDWPSIKCTLIREKGKHKKIEAADPSGNVFGTVDTHISEALAPLMDSPSANIRVQARLDVRKKTGNQWPGQPCSEVYRVTLNVYGLRKMAERVGNLLSQKNIWLGPPNSVEAGISTFNPHAEKRAAGPRFAPAAGPGYQISGPGPYDIRTAEEVNSAVMKMFDQLKGAESLPEMETPPALLTTLLHHQKQALWFMTEKEKPRKFGPKDEDNNSLWRKDLTSTGRQFFREIVSGTTTYDEPPEVLGGLLADMMGLGKTLSILSLVVASQAESLAWAELQPPPALRTTTSVTRNAKTTLLVSPLSAVGNWVDQIKEHLKESSLSVNIFHGGSRTIDPDELAEYDIVITTYSTVLSEIGRKNSKRVGVSPLSKLNLFRIVLDEAHIIREQSTAQSQAIFSLQAQRRWSVTGTPIQNRLDDLAAVTRFLRMYPFDDKGRFAQYILNPFKNEDPKVLATLRVLVDSFTLRRVKDRINLPPRHDKIITLKFSPEEEKLHEYFRSESNAMMNVIAGESKKKIAGRMYHHVLRAMMLLRRISAHGRELLDPDERERTKGLSANDAIDLEESGGSRTGLTEKKTYEMFALMKESAAEQCVKCSNGFEEKRTEAGVVDKDAAIAVMLPCWDVFCMDCFEQYRETFDANAQTGAPVQCFFCDAETQPSYQEITPAGFEKYQESLVSDKLSPKKAKALGQYERPHTKTKALVGYLLESAKTSSENPDEAPIKSVVFSSWTSHLDLIEIALKDNGLHGFTRLDGTMTLKNRNQTLETFREDNNVTILLATLGAGGVGLNLTAGSNVYIMEPQYNPAAVAQAIDRIHRLGQKREVTTVQFIMKDSIEEKIAELAKKKQQLADMSMNRGKMDKREVQQDRMKEYRSLFK